MGVVRVRVVLLNRKAFERLMQACELVAAAAEDYPWSEDLKEARRCLRYAANRLGMIEEDR